MKNKVLTVLYFWKGCLRLLKSSTVFTIKGTRKRYPKVIQLPITYRCNAKCVMCNIWKMDHSNETTLDEFGGFMKDPIFKKVEAVGINGGEPTLLPNLVEYAEEIIKLPSLKSLNIISNGYSSKLLFKNAEKIYKVCKGKGIKFHISISLDGVGAVHNVVRGVPIAFEKVIVTLDELIKNKQKYCDSYDIGATIVNQNINHLIELDQYARWKGYNIKYRLGIENKRIESNKLNHSYSVIHGPNRQGAKEFFHYQMTQATDLASRFKYYSIFCWLNDDTPKRKLGCAWKEEGVTLDAKGNIYYCAVESDCIGTLRNGKGEEIFFDKKNIEYRKHIIKNRCNNCIHDYTGKPQFINVLLFLADVIKNRFAMNIYFVKARFLK
ncbi:radical SAM domain protein [Chitinispirillum alkaliphilum]|nr:radical SAM domain protein [Chitinispirillum alkaliphilum]